MGDRSSGDTLGRAVVRRATRLARPARREQLVRAAAAAFLERGFDGTSMETVADHAGVTRMLVYRHFDSKEALYRAVMASAVDQLQASFDPEVAGTEPGVAGQLLAAARETPDAFRLLWRHAQHEPEFAVDAREFRQVATDFADALLTNLIPDRGRRRWSAVLIVDFLYGGICNWLDDGDPAGDDEFARHLHWGVVGLIGAWGDPAAVEARQVVQADGQPSRS
jgi:AcrR family transcriptional regulator